MGFKKHKFCSCGEPVISKYLPLCEEHYDKEFERLYKQKREKNKMILALSKQNIKDIQKGKKLDFHSPTGVVVWVRKATEKEEKQIKGENGN